MPRIEVFTNVDELALHAAEEFSGLAKKSIAEYGRYSVALSGGSTPKRLFQELVSADVEWKKTHLFWADERCVPPDNLDSNYGMTAVVLLDRITIPRENIHRIQGEKTPEAAAKTYAEELRIHFGGLIPTFDLILLGVGTDGHTASLFPGSPALLEEERWVVGVQHETPPLPLVDRVTLTYPVLKLAREVIFLVSGDEKAKILARIFKSPSILDPLPVQEISKNHPNTRWFIDRDSADSWYKS
jgi:6-phosphogluconolactonase